jgi:hypothetical protein
MTERRIPCPRCHQENLPTNRFCGSCGVQLTSGEQLATRQEHRLVPAARAWPAKLGPVSKTLAVGVAVLAAEAGLSWLQRKIGAEERSSVRADRDAGSASRGYLVSQSLEEVLLQAWENSHGRVITRREVRSFLTTGPTGKGRKNGKRPVRNPARLSGPGREEYRQGIARTPTKSRRRNGVNLGRCRLRQRRCGLASTSTRKA